MIPRDAIQIRSHDSAKGPEWSTHESFAAATSRSFLAVFMLRILLDLHSPLHAFFFSIYVFGFLVFTLPSFGALSQLLLTREDHRCRRPPRRIVLRPRLHAFLCSLHAVQAHRPTVSPSHHLIPRRRGRRLSTSALLARATGGDVPALTRSSRAESGEAARAGSIEWTMMSPNDPRRECCSFLFQRAMVVSEEGVRGGLDHLRDEEVRNILARVPHVCLSILG